MHNLILDEVMKVILAYSKNTPISDPDIDPLNLKTSQSTATYGKLSMYLPDVLFSPDMPESTSLFSINEENKRYLDFLKGKEAYFLTLIKRADFEDGMTNEATNFVEQNFALNESVTVNWLLGVYSHNQSDAVLLSGILRCLSFVDLVNSSYRDSFTAMIAAALGNPNAICQESALVLIENLRTQDCLDAIRNAKHTLSLSLLDYARQIETELTEELTEERSTIITKVC